MWTDGETDGQVYRQMDRKNMAKPIVAFRSFANVPKKTTDNYYNLGLWRCSFNSIDVQSTQISSSPVV